MSWTPISGTVPQYQQSTGDLASAYYLKAYAAGTSTAINMATDSTGGTTLDKIQINSGGYPVNSSGGVIIPHVSQAYKLVLYKNSTDADNNTTANADWVIDSLSQSAAAVSSQNVNIEYQNGSSATANKFTLASLVYTVGVNNLAIFENGQRLRLGSSYDYTETSSTEVTLTYTPLDNAVYTFVQGETTTSTVSDASAVTYTPAGAGAVATNVQAKLREGVSVKDFGAVGDFSNDDGAAIQSAFAGANSQAVLFPNTGNGENPSSASLPPLEFPHGVYSTTVPLTNSIAYSYFHVRGSNSIVTDSPSFRTVSEAFRFNLDWSMDGLEIRGFQKAIVIDNNNTNQSHHWITNCHFHKQSVAVIEFENNPQSGQMTIERGSATTYDGSKFLYMPTTAERVDFLAIRDFWLQPALNSSNTFNIDGTLMDLRCSSCIIENLTGVPTGTLSSSVPASWMRFYGTNLQINHSNFGPELTGGVTMLENFAEATESTDLKTQISVTNSRWGTSGSRPLIRFFKLPNTITIRAMNDDGVNGGIEYVDATDADGISESSGIDIDNLKAFAKDGAVMVDSWDYIASKQTTMGTHAGLGYQLVIAAYYDQVGVPYKDKVKVDDILCCTAHNQGTKSTGGSGTSGADSTDYRGVPVRTRTATTDGASYQLQWNAFIDYTLIGASADGDDCAMTLLVELEYTPAKQGSASFVPSIAQNNKRYPLEPGNKTYAVPFVFFNTTNAADTSLDSLVINVSNMANGDAVAFKRVVVLKGFQQTDIEQITAFQEVVTTPPDIANTKFDSNAGWVTGDRVLNHATSTEVPYYVCKTEQTGTTAWASGAVLT